MSTRRGRWSLLGDIEAAAEEPVISDTQFSDEAAEQVALTLLDRYGVVFRHLLQRESRRLPPWRQLWRIYRRLEARGEVRGGRFVSGFAGEQFACRTRSTRCAACTATARVRMGGRSSSRPPIR